MYCYSCGKELPPGAATCPACQAPVLSPGGHPAAGDAVDQFVADVRKGTKEVIHASAQLSRTVVSKAGAAAKDPSGSAKSATKRVAQGLKQIAKDIERDLKDL